jgi:hypothetical protein
VHVEGGEIEVDRSLDPGSMDDDLRFGESESDLLQHEGTNELASDGRALPIMSIECRTRDSRWSVGQPCRMSMSDTLDYALFGWP